MLTGGCSTRPSRPGPTFLNEAASASVLCWWNEDKRELAAVADLVVHVPVRADQLAALRRLATTVLARQPASASVTALV
jgi:hypothetical protein